MISPVFVVTKSLEPPSGRIQKVEPQFWTLILLSCRFKNPEVDVLFGSSEGFEYVASKGFYERTGIPD